MKPFREGASAGWCIDCHFFFFFHSAIARMNRGSWKFIYVLQNRIPRIAFNEYLCSFPSFLSPHSTPLMLLLLPDDLWTNSCVSFFRSILLLRLVRFFAISLLFSRSLFLCLYTWKSIKRFFHSHSRNIVRRL